MMKNSAGLESVVSDGQLAPTPIAGFFRRNHDERVSEDDIAELDVPLGRGKSYISHRGTVRFQFIINQNVDRYFYAATNHDKKAITADIVAEIEKYGRFLRYDQKQQKWERINSEVARTKVAQALQYRQRRRASGYDITSIEGISSALKRKQPQTRQPKQRKKTPSFSALGCSRNEDSPRNALSGHQLSQSHSSGPKRDALVGGLSHCQPEWQSPLSISTGYVSMANWQLSNQLAFRMALSLLQQRSDQINQTKQKQNGNFAFEPLSFVPHQAQPTAQTSCDPARLEPLQFEQSNYASTSPPAAQASGTAFQPLTMDSDFLRHLQISQQQEKVTTQTQAATNSVAESSVSLDPLPFDVETAVPLWDQYNNNNMEQQG